MVWGAELGKRAHELIEQATGKPCPCSDGDLKDDRFTALVLGLEAADTQPRQPRPPRLLTA